MWSALPFREAKLSFEVEVSEMNNNPSNGSETKQSTPADLELLTPKEAAGFLRLSGSFLAKARMRGDGPRYRKLGRSVRYLRADLLLWLKAGAPNGERNLQNYNPLIRAEEQMRARGLKTVVAGFAGLPAGVKVPAAKKR